MRIAATPRAAAAICRGKEGNKGNYANDHVDGRRDLLDFFPVWLDIHDVLNKLPSGANTQVRLDCYGLNVVYTGLSSNEAGNFLTSDMACYGPVLNQRAHEATVIRPAGGVGLNSTILPDTFVNLIRNDANKGVLLLEGCASSPSITVTVLVNGKETCWFRLNTAVRPVEWLMYRIDGLDDAFAMIPEPAYSPYYNEKHVIFLHGFNVTPAEAREWHCEMFKRLWQSGSNGFHAVTWRGDIGTPNGFHYHENVNSAFQAAPHLANYVNSLSGEKIIMTHSLEQFTF